MNTYADTGFITSLFLPESTSTDARNALKGLQQPLPLIPLTVLEFRNSLNLAIGRHRITQQERDHLWILFEKQLLEGIFTEVSVPSQELHRKARELSDRYSPTLATRSLDLLHLAAAQLLQAKLFFSFDLRQRKAAAAENMRVLPS
jgi:predicted nucleic acid-binding protein